MGFGVYSDKKADQAVEDAKKKKAVGSEFFNTLAGICGAEFMKFGATLYPCDVKTRDSYANMDVAGYNYGIKRYEHDLKKYPDRIILGSETFCSDAYRFWELAKTSPRLIGDFVWAGMDYLGEVGIGSWEYKDYAPRFDNGLGWVSAGSGRIDLTGKPLSEAKYTRVAFEFDKIGMGVVPVAHASEKHSPSAWKMTNAMESWSWHGCDGKETQVEVYARADSVKLYVNKKCVGKKKLTGDCKAIFKTKYYDGSVTAVSYDSAGKELARYTLKTAGEETMLSVEPELTEVSRENGLCYVRMRYTDKKGTLKPMARGRIKLAVEGGTLLGFGSACPYYPDGYLGDTADTYYGEALAVIKPDRADTVRIKATSPYGDAETAVKVTDKGEN
jgi:beta-galactosidase